MLEPAGTIEIKFKMKDLVKAMRRLDETYSNLYKKLASPGMQISCTLSCFLHIFSPMPESSDFLKAANLTHHIFFVESK